MLGHLLGNALKFTRAGGAVDVDVAVEAGSGVQVRVRDLGPGLRPDQIAKLWRPYAQVHDTMEHTEGGVGLGLFVVERIISMHGGRVGVDSAGPGHGATFWFTLPGVVQVASNPAGA